MSLLEEVIGSFRSQKRLADRAIDQLDEGEFNTTLGDEGNSIATICQHVAGNQRSRWTDFLTTDGEKPDRHRDEEFEPSGAPRGEILDRWEANAPGRRQVMFRALMNARPSHLLDPKLFDFAGLAIDNGPKFKPE